MNNKTPKNKSKTKRLKRPLSCIDKKIQCSESDLFLDLPTK